jgi:vesicle-associated membrane protein-associated protein A
MLQAMKEEPPLNAKCKDKFLIQSMLIPPEKAALPPHDLVRVLSSISSSIIGMPILTPQWNVSEGEETGKVHSQKVKVNYLPPEGHPLEEEDEFPRTSMMTGIAPDDVSIRAVAGRPRTYVAPDDQISVIHEPLRPVIVERPATPLDYSGQQDDEPSREEPSGGVGVINVNVHSSQPPPVPAPLIAPPPPSEPSPEFVSKYKDAQEEIQRLRALLAAVPDPSSVASSGTSPTVLRQRHSSSRSPRSDDGTVVESDVTYATDSSLQPEGVPLQVVVIISLLVFITTYLFF